MAKKINSKKKKSIDQGIRHNVLSETVVERFFNKGNIVKAIMMPTYNKAYDFVTVDNEKIECKIISGTHRKSSKGRGTMNIATGGRRKINKICDYFYGYDQKRNVLCKYKNEKIKKTIRTNANESVEIISLSCENNFSDEDIQDIFKIFYKKQK